MAAAAGQVVVNVGACVCDTKKLEIRKREKTFRVLDVIVTVGRLNAVTHEGKKIRPGLAPETLQ